MTPHASPFAPPSLVRLTHVIYALHALSVVIGITSTVTIIGAFLFGVPSLVAVVLNYVERSKARGTYLESHFSWQIRTFWSCALLSIVGILLFVTLVGIPLALVLFAGLTLWVVYRIIRGWLALKDGRPVP